MDTQKNGWIPTITGGDRAGPARFTYAKGDGIVEKETSMGVMPFSELMDDAEKRGYAVGYFEAWNMESLFAVADAAERTGSPVILGFSGIYLPHRERIRTDDLRHYASLVLSVCRGLSVPCCSIFNESSNFEWVMESIDAGFHLVMFTDEHLNYQEQTAKVSAIVRKAHGCSSAVEGESSPLPGAGGGAARETAGEGGPRRGEDIDRALEFVTHTGIDAFAVDIGQVHVHGRRRVDLDFDTLTEMKKRIPVPLVLHGASSLGPDTIRTAIDLGIRKINVASSMKRVYFDALRTGCREAGDEYNPYEIIGSGLEKDVLMKGRLAIQNHVEDLIKLFGSAGKSGG